MSKHSSLRFFGDGRAKEFSDASALLCEDPSLTQQQFKDDSDPNVIMAKFARTGDVSLINVYTPQYGDFVDATDYQSSLNVVLAAQEAFASVDARVRKRFGNDPAEFLAFCNDPANAEEMVFLGLAKARVLPLEPVKASSPTHGAGKPSKGSPAPSKGQESPDDSQA